MPRKYKIDDAHGIGVADRTCVEAPVLEGATGVMMNEEGHGLGEAGWRGSTTRAGRDFAVGCILPSSTP